MLGDDEIKEMQEEIHMLEEQLRERKRALHDARFSGIRAAMKAREEADKLLAEEFKALGVRPFNWKPFF